MVIRGIGGIGAAPALVRVSTASVTTDVCALAASAKARGSLAYESLAKQCGAQVLQRLAEQGKLDASQVAAGQAQGMIRADTVVPASAAVAKNLKGPKPVSKAAVAGSAAGVLGLGALLKWVVLPRLLG